MNGVEQETLCGRFIVNVVAQVCSKSTASLKLRRIDYSFELAQDMRNTQNNMSDKSWFSYGNWFSSFAGAL
jgi:hypothetical protein